MWVKKRGGHQPVGILVQTSWQVGIPSGNNFSKHLFSSKTNCSKPQKQKSSVFPPFWTLSNTFQTPVKRCPQKLNTKTKSPGKQRTSSFSERFFWHFNFRSLFRFYLIPPKTSRIFATFSPFQFNSTLFHPFQPFYVSLVNSHFGRIGEKGLSAADTDRLVCGEHSDDRSILSAAGTGREQHPFVHGGAERAAGCRKGKRKNML